MVSEYTVSLGCSYRREVSVGDPLKAVCTLAWLSVLIGGRHSFTTSSFVSCQPCLMVRHENKVLLANSENSRMQATFTRMHRWSVNYPSVWQSVTGVTLCTVHGCLLILTNHGLHFIISYHIYSDCLIAFLSYFEEISSLICRSANWLTANVRESFGYVPAGRDWDQKVCLWSEQGWRLTLTVRVPGVYVDGRNCDRHCIILRSVVPL